MPLPGYVGHTSVIAASFTELPIPTEARPGDFVVVMASTNGVVGELADPRPTIPIPTITGGYPNLGLFAAFILGADRSPIRAHWGDFDSCGLVIAYRGIRFSPSLPVAGTNGRGTPGATPVLGGVELGAILVNHYSSDGAGSPAPPPGYILDASNGPAALGIMVARWTPDSPPQETPSASWTTATGRVDRWRCYLSQLEPLAIPTRRRPPLRGRQRGDGLGASSAPRGRQHTTRQASLRGNGIL